MPPPRSAAGAQRAAAGDGTVGEREVAGVIDGAAPAERPHGAIFDGQSGDAGDGAGGDVEHAALAVPADGESLAPGPLIVTFPAICGNSTPASVMVEPFSPLAKSMAVAFGPPVALARLIASRSERSPEVSAGGGVIRGVDDDARLRLEGADIASARRVDGETAFIGAGSAGADGRAAAAKVRSSRSGRRNSRADSSRGRR